jgi:glycine/D-amino acid oxidase-like deaminating enzyme
LFEKQNVQSISFTPDDKPIIKTDLKSYYFDKAVIACGAFSKKLTDQFDEKIPLETERGYHVHFKGYDHLLSRPVIFLNRGFGITPMEQGLRVVGTVEFGGLKNPPSKKRILNLVNNAKYLLPQLKEHQDEWLGFRPTLPDFLPVLGPSKNYKNLFYSFGHHHLGWTLGAISGKIISGLVAGENTNLDLSAYNSKRF